MALKWKGPGSLLIHGRLLIQPGQEIPDGSLPEQRILDLGLMIEYVRPAVKPVPVVHPLPVQPVVLSEKPGAVTFHVPLIKRGAAKQGGK